MTTTLLGLMQAIDLGFVKCGAGTIIEPNALFQPTAESDAPAVIGDNSSIGSGTILGGGAEIGKDCHIGPFVTIGAGCKIGDGTVLEQGCGIGAGVQIGARNKILPHSFITNHVEIGDENVIGPFISIGTDPQHLAERVSHGMIRIGSRNVLREYMTVHMPIHELTMIGSDCYMMAYNHIPHDAQIYDHVTMANSCQLGGHTIIHHHANLGFSCALHQYSVVGAGAMVAMGSVVVKDIPPHVIFISGVATRLNQVGLERRGKSSEEIRSLRDLYARANSSTLEEAAGAGADEWWYPDFQDFMRAQKRKTCDFSRVGSAQSANE